MRKQHRWVGSVVVVLAVGACRGGNEQGHISANVRGDMQFANVTHLRYDAGSVETCGAGGVTTAGEQGMPRWPYVQKVTDESAELLFTSTEDHEFRVVARTPDGEVLADVPAVADDSVTPSVGTQYVAKLKELPAHAMVCWQLTADDDAWTAPIGFRTAPAPDADATVNFIAVGDLGKRTPDQYAVLEQMMHVPMELAVVTGDVAYDNGEPAELEANFFGVYREMLGHVPFFPATGNHDYKTDGARPFRDAFALPENGGERGRERWYSFDWGPVHFAMFDTEDDAPEQLAWLDDDLAEHDRPWTIAVGHRPPYSAGSHGSDGAARAKFSPIFAKHNVPLVLVGHEHDYERTHPQDGVVYVVTGGGGRGTRPVGEEDFTAVIDRVAHFVWLEASPQQLRLVAIDATGQPFDSMAVTK